MAHVIRAVDRQAAFFFNVVSIVQVVDPASGATYYYHTVTGKSSWEFQGYFQGSISQLSVYGGALDMYAVDCMYQDLEATANRCSDPSQGQGRRSRRGGRGGGGRFSGYYNSFMDGSTIEEMKEGGTFVKVVHAGSNR